PRGRRARRNPVENWRDRWDPWLEDSLNQNASLSWMPGVRRRKTPSHLSYPATLQILSRGNGPCESHAERRQVLQDGDSEGPAEDRKSTSLNSSQQNISTAG